MFKTIDWYKEVRGVDCHNNDIGNGLFMYGGKSLSKDEFAIFDGNQVDPKFLSVLSIAKGDMNAFVITKAYNSFAYTFDKLQPVIHEYFPYLSISIIDNDELLLGFSIDKNHILYQRTVQITEGTILCTYDYISNMYIFFDKNGVQREWIQFNIIDIENEYLISIKDILHDNDMDERLYIATKYHRNGHHESVSFNSSSILNGHFIPIKYEDPQKHLEIVYDIGFTNYLVYTEIKNKNEAGDDVYVTPPDHSVIAYAPLYINDRHFDININSGVTIYNTISTYSMEIVTICGPESIK